MTGPTVKSCLESAEKCLEASYDSSEALRFLAIRAAISEIIEAIGIIQRESREVKEDE